jgi:hypothetical protein
LRFVVAYQLEIHILIIEEESQTVFGCTCV